MLVGYNAGLLLKLFGIPDTHVRDGIEYAVCGLDINLSANSCTVTITHVGEKFIQFSEVKEIRKDGEALKGPTITALLRILGVPVKDGERYTRVSINVRPDQVVQYMMACEVYRSPMQQIAKLYDLADTQKTATTVEFPEPTNLH